MSLRLPQKLQLYSGTIYLIHIDIFLSLRVTEILLLWTITFSKTNLPIVSRTF